MSQAFGILVFLVITLQTTHSGMLPGPQPQNRGYDSGYVATEMELPAYDGGRQSSSDADSSDGTMRDGDGDAGNGGELTDQSRPHEVPGPVAALKCCAFGGMCIIGGGCPEGSVAIPCPCPW